MRFDVDRQAVGLAGGEKHRAWLHDQFAAGQTIGLPTLTVARAILSPTVTPKVTVPGFLAVSESRGRIELHHARAFRHDVGLLADVEIAPHDLEIASQLQALAQRPSR